MDILELLFKQSFNQSSHQSTVISASFQKMVDTDFNFGLGRSSLDNVSDELNTRTEINRTELSNSYPLSGETQHFTWSWNDVGILQINAKTQDNASIDTALVISVGIHGNETAPIEIVRKIIWELFSFQQEIQTNVLVILGNPAAILQGKRYLHSDMNRMFSGRTTQFVESPETQRVKVLEYAVTTFFSEQSAECCRLHLDIHTAIRSSHYRRFALLPFQSSTYDSRLKNLFSASNLDAVVFHKQTGGTFSQFTLTECDALSCTLELGKALPFGENNLSDFSDIDSTLRVLIKLGIQGLETLEISESNKAHIDYFEVKKSLIKFSDINFKLFVDASCPNFEPFTQGTLILKQQNNQENSIDENVRSQLEEYRVEDKTEWILFPNPSVALGLRAGMMLKKLEKECLKQKFG